MGSTFNSYHIASTGMYVNQAGLTTVSHNLSNVNTTGYSRQRSISEEQRVMVSSTTSYGNGVKVEEVSRQRDCFLDQTYRAANATTEYYDTKNTVLTDAQKLLNEYGSSSDSSTASTNGLQQTVKNFFNSWEQLTKESDGQTTRDSVLEYASNLLTTVNEMDEQLTEMQDDAVSRVEDGVDSLNDKADQVAKLNAQIMQASNSGDDANDLEDQRDELLDEMSKLSNITTVEQASGQVNVYIGGVALVDTNTTHTLTAVAANDTVKVEWAQFNADADISTGSIKAYMEEANKTGVTEITDSDTYDFANDGSSSNLASLRQGLNNLVTTIADKVNSLLESGKDLEGNAGVALFVKTDDTKGFMVGNIQLNTAITNDNNKLATGTTGKASDNTIATKISDILDDKDFTYESSKMDVTDYYQELISWVSTTGETVSSNYDTQNTLLQQADSQRQSISSVSEDEEMSKMIVYQNAYNASARYLSTVDSLIGDLIAAIGS